MNDKMTIELVNDDIIYDEVGAIVNPSNSGLDHNYGLSDQISTIGGPVIESESREWVEKCEEVPVGQCAITRSGKLECQFVIHTNAPVFSDYKSEDEASEILQGSVLNTLETARALNVESVSMTAISSGRKEFPADLCALKMVLAAINFC